jgi:hypothetical protein
MGHFGKLQLPRKQGYPMQKLARHPIGCVGFAVADLQQQPKQLPGKLLQALTNFCLSFDATHV